MGRRAPRRVAALAVVFAATAASVASAGEIQIPAGADSSTTTIGFPGSGSPFAYSPKVLAVERSGASLAQVTWSGNSFSPMGGHPLRFEDIGVAGQSSGASTTRNLRSGRYLFYCAIHGGPGGSGMSGEVYVAGPRAALKATPADIAPGGTVTLDAGATDLVSFGGLTATYAFDPEGDGTFLPAGSATSMQATYPAEGQPTASVRVLDSSGRVDEATVAVDVAVPGTKPPAQPDPPGDPAKPTAPAVTTTPGSTTTTTKKRRATRFTDVAKLPRFGHCVKPRSGVRIRVRDATDADVRSVRVLVNGHLARRRAIGRSATIAVRPLPPGRPLVKVVVTLAGGKRLARTTRYRVCRG